MEEGESVWKRERVCGRGIECMEEGESESTRSTMNKSLATCARTRPPGTCRARAKREHLEKVSGLFPKARTRFWP